MASLMIFLQDTEDMDLERYALDVCGLITASKQSFDLDTDEAYAVHTKDPHSINQRPMWAFEIEGLSEKEIYQATRDIHKVFLQLYDYQGDKELLIEAHPIRHCVTRVAGKWDRHDIYISVKGKL